MNKQQLVKYGVSALIILFINLNLKGQSQTLTEHIDIEYYSTTSPDPELTKLNLILPDGIENPPVFIWIGQGAWAYVNKDVEMNICRKIAEQGIAVVSAGHRLSPALLGEKKRYEGIKHPEHVKDIAQAFKWVYESAEKYGYSNKNIFVGGYSSGAHLAALLAMDNKYLKHLELSNKMIRAIIPVGGGYDIPDYKKQLIAEDPSYEANHINVVFGETDEEHIDASPITYLDSLITPILMISESDTYTYSRIFEEALVNSSFEDFEVINAHNRTHASLWRELGGEEPSVYRKLIVDYIKSRSK